MSSLVFLPAALCWWAKKIIIIINIFVWQPKVEVVTSEAYATRHVWPSGVVVTALDLRLFHWFHRLATLITHHPLVLTRSLFRTTAEAAEE